MNQKVNIQELVRAIEKHRADICTTAGILANRGWAESNGGNFSIRLEEGFKPSGDNIGLTTTYPDLARRCFLVTLKGSRMRDISKNPLSNLGLVKITEGGSSYLLESKQGKVTSEFPSHLAAHQALIRKRPSHRVFIHTHPTHLVALTHLAEAPSQVVDRLVAMFPEAALLLYENLSCLPYIAPGTEEMSQRTAQALKQTQGVIWSLHGMAASGTGLPDSLDIIETAEKAAKVALLLGEKSKGLNPQQIQHLYRTFRNGS